MTLKRLTMMSVLAMGLLGTGAMMVSVSFGASLRDTMGPQDVLLVVDQDGRPLFAKNELKKSVPASTLKILTALTALHHLGPTFRFKTEFYVDADQNLTVKGYGDPLLISEVWAEIARVLAPRLAAVRDIVLDDTYFDRDIEVPGSAGSTNPYDAPLGALSANFNTVFFERSGSGAIVSAEPQTPMTPLAEKRVRRLSVDSGRYTFTHRHNEIIQYAGELFTHFLRLQGVQVVGQIRPGKVGADDRLLYRHDSPYPLEEGLKKMLAFSSNFMANQILLAMGAEALGPPGTLEKGVAVVARHAREVLHLDGFRIVEGSGISRENRISAVDMVKILKAFEPYRHLLTQEGDMLFKSGTLTGLRARAGFVECPGADPYCFVMFLKGSRPIEAAVKAMRQALPPCPE